MGAGAFRHGATYAGHPTACAAANAALDLYERDGLIERGRGWVRVLDRNGLKAAACGCYGQMRAVMDELDLRTPKAA